jgi:DNA invertase Pin-like site-specific DNA recombinase
VAAPHVVGAPEAKVRPELEKALALTRDIKQATPGQPVVLTVHEMKRLARNAAEFMTLAAQLQAGGIQLELLSGPLVGIYDPRGVGSMLFAVLAVATQFHRDYIRERTLEGQQVAASRGNHGGRPKVVNADMIVFIRALRDQRVRPRHREDADHQVRPEHPSVASLYRVLADADRAQAVASSGGQAISNASCDEHHIRAVRALRRTGRVSGRHGTGRMSGAGIPSVNPVTAFRTALVRREPCP